jgi:ribosomal protein S20
MTVSAISANSYLQNIASSSAQAPSSGASTRSAFKSLAQALQSGDLQGAQQAFTTIQSAWSARLTQTSPNTQSTNGSNTTVQNAFSSLGQALQSGNLQGAQQAFNTLQSAVQHNLKAHRGHHHHAPDPNNGTTATGTSNGTNTTGVTNSNTVFSSLLQQLAANSSSGMQGKTDLSTFLGSLLQQSGGANGVATGTASRSNQSSFSILA